MESREEAKKLFNNNFSTKKVNKNCQLRESWIWDKTVEDFVKTE